MALQTTCCSPEPPDALTQHKLFTSLEKERSVNKSNDEQSEDINITHYKYAVSTKWLRAFKKHIGLIENKHPGQTIHPGEIYMDLICPDKNEYIPGFQWQLLIGWYGIQSSHQLDRKFIPDLGDDDKIEVVTFEICLLNKLAGHLKHLRKEIDVTEIVGYIECQMRCIFRVPYFCKSRLWIKEKNDNGFKPLLDRTEELGQLEGISDQGQYILALEICDAGADWPSGLFDEPIGSLDFFDNVTIGKKDKDFWDSMYSNILQEQEAELVNSLKSVAKSLTMKSKYLNSRKEAQLSKMNTELKELIAENKEENLNVKNAMKNLQERETTLHTKHQDLMAKHALFVIEKQNLEKELSFLNEIKQNIQGKVDLNVGGHNFSTSAATLTRFPDSMLGAMFSGRHILNKSSDGRVFIDRDGRHFHFILNFLRSGTAMQHEHLPDELLTLNELKVEADYYQIDPLTKLLDLDIARQTGDLHEVFAELSQMYGIFDD